MEHKKTIIFLLVIWLVFNVAFAFYEYQDLEKRKDSGNERWEQVEERIKTIEDRVKELEDGRVY